jgi:hypothetical protein
MSCVQGTLQVAKTAPLLKQIDQKKGKNKIQEHSQEHVTIE